MKPPCKEPVNAPLGGVPSVPPGADTYPESRRAATVAMPQLNEAPLKKPDNPHLDGMLMAILATYEESGPAAALALAPLALPEAAAIAVTFYTRDPASMDALGTSPARTGYTLPVKGGGLCHHLCTCAVFGHNLRIARRLVC